MPSVEVVFNIAALDEVLKGPNGPVAAYLGRVGLVVETHAKLNLSQGDMMAVDQGRLRGSITHVVERDGNELAVFIGTNVHYGIFVHEGRRPGAKMPPVDVIQEWAQHKRIITSTDTPSQARGKAFVIARAIARRGIKPKRFLTEALPSARGVH